MNDASTTDIAYFTIVTVGHLIQNIGSSFAQRCQWKYLHRLMLTELRYEFALANLHNQDEGSYTYT